jgi:phage-related protein/DNA-binding XRE family transcriptional regulator
MSPRDKPLVWMHGGISSPPFSANARIEAGYLLRQVQKGVKLSLPQSRPMLSIGTRCHELRINDENLTWRIVYRIYTDAILILDVFEKKTKKSQNQISIFASKESIALKPILKKVKNNMDTKKKKILESKGYKVGTVKEFLGLSPEETEYIELKLALSDALAKRRKKSNLTQAQLAKLLNSSQSRVAKMEKGDPTVSVDLLVKSLLALGADKKIIARAIA